MPLFLLTILLGSCSPKPTESDSQLPRYSDMSAAHDAMNAK
jgi:hypothetical protein